MAGLQSPDDTFDPNALVAPPPPYATSTPGSYDPNQPWVPPPGQAQAIASAQNPTGAYGRSTPGTPGAVNQASASNSGIFGGGWDQASPGTPQGALQEALSQGLKGQAAVDFANSKLGLVPPNSIAANADGTYGLPNGFYVAPNPQNPNALDLISRGGGSSSGQVGPYGSNGFEGSPGYAYEQAAAENAVQSSAAARGTLLSTGTEKDLESTAAGIAGQAFALDTSNLFGLAGIGQNATNQAGGYITGGANAQAAGTVGGANSLIGGANGVSNAALTGYIYNKFNPTATTPQYGPTPAQIPGYGTSTYPLGHG